MDCLGIQEVTNPGGVELIGDPQGPDEGSTTLCHVEASLIGMQPRSPSGKATLRVGNDIPGHSHDAQ